MQTERQIGLVEATVFREVEDNADEIVRAIGRESVGVYAFLATEFAKGPIVDNYVFQFVYRSYYRLDNAGLTARFKIRYFELMQQCRSTGLVNIEELVSELHEYENLRRRKTLQFSFVTKLANTVSDTYPIYDAEVARVFGFKPPPNSKKFDTRLMEYMSFYKRLQAVYLDIIYKDRLPKARAAFESLYSNERGLPKVKLLDFIIWSAGKRARKAKGHRRRARRKRHG